MTLDELVSSLMFDVVDGPTEERIGSYEVVIERDNLDSEPTLRIKGVRWEHDDRRVVIEAES